MFVLFLLVCLFSSCATYSTKISKKVAEPSPESPADSIYHTVYLIGDAGNAPLNESTETLDHLAANLAEESEKASIIWLGDNIYPNGLAPEGFEDRELDIHRLNAQLNTVLDFEGNVYFIPGNHDWYKYGIAGIKRQGNYIDSVLTQQNNKRNSNFFMPDNGCGDPQLVSLAENIDLLLMDSHWFVQRKKEPREQCICKDRDEFLTRIETLVDESQAQTIITTLHHPPYTYGHHGGGYSLKETLFPLTHLNKKLYIPIPLFGINKLRNIFLNQDNKNPRYIRLRKGIIRALDKKGPSIVASGHEHNLQHIRKGIHDYIVSGAGSKSNPCKLGSGSLFCTGKNGYVRLLFYSPTLVMAEFIVPGSNEETGDVVYSSIIHLTTVSQ